MNAWIMSRQSNVSTTQNISDTFYEYMRICLRNVLIKDNLHGFRSMSVKREGLVKGIIVVEGVGHITKLQITIKSFLLIPCLYPLPCIVELLSMWLDLWADSDGVLLTPRIAIRVRTFTDVTRLLALLILCKYLPTFLWVVFLTQGSRFVCTYLIITWIIMTKLLPNNWFLSIF